MHIVTDLISVPPFKSPCGLTIGTFDGVHLGHQALFQSLRSHLPHEGTLCALTFSNHPTDIFSHRSPIPMLTTFEHKLKLFEQVGVDLAIAIPFTVEFAAQPFADFLINLKQKINFTHLTLGAGASFGKNRQGDEAHVRTLSQSLHFTAEYLPKVVIDGLPVSSGRIRGHLAKGEFSAVKNLLGRPYSIYAPFIKKNNTTYSHVPGLCLPPNGTYPIQLKLVDQLLAGRATIEQETATVQLDIPFFNALSFSEIIFI